MRKFLNRFSMYKMKRENSLLVPLYLLAFLLLASCAKMGQPDGGWYDETPPKVIGADPADGGINVKSKKVNIYSVVAFVIGGVAQMTPVTFPFMPMIVALFTGTVFMLYVAKIPRKGALSILGVIAAILLFVTGMFWMMSVFFLVFGLIADFICASADFRSFKKNLLAYCVMALAPMGTYIPMVVMPAQFDAFMKNI